MSNFEEYRKLRIQEIKNDPNISKYIKNCNFSDTFIEENYNIFNNCFKSLEICKHCTGLNNCSQEKKGEFIGLTFNGILNNNAVCCPLLLKKEKVAKHVNSFVYSDIPYIHANINLSNIPIAEESLKQLYVMCNSIYTSKTNKGLYIYGDLGVGKTYMAIALANSLVDINKKVAFIKINDFANKMAQLIREDALEYESLLNTVKKADYLFIDDIGAETVSEFTRDRLLYNILDHRMENKLCTIFTSNYDKHSLYKHFVAQNEMSAKRLMERIDILTDDYCLTGTNKRRV